MNRILVAALVVVAAPCQAAAQWRAEQFTSNDGLPQNTISDIAQTPDGYLWISTYDGLARFDGVTFTIFDRGTTPAMLRTQFQNIRVDGAGAMWAGTDQGVLRYRDGEFRWFDPVPSDSGRKHPGDPHQQPSFVPVKPPRWRMDGATLVRDAANADSAIRIQLPRENLRIGAEDARGNVWVIGRNYVARYGGDPPITIDVVPLLGTSSVRAAFVDRDGTLWLGSNETGLYRITPRVVTSYSVEDGLGGRIVYPLTEDSLGRVWIGAGRGITRWDHGRFSTLGVIKTGESSYELRSVTSGWGASDDPRAAAVRAMYTDRKGLVWLSLIDALIALDGDRVVRSIPVGTSTDAMLVDRTGALWVNDKKQLRRIRGDSARTFGPAQGFPDAFTNAILEDSQGNVWVGTRHGLAKCDATRCTTYTHANGLAGDIVRSLYEDASGALWIGTFDAGLSRFKNGKFASISTHDGLFSNGVFQILEDARGQFWMSSNRGIFRVSRLQLDNFADGHIHHVISIAYGARDGMRSTEANGGRSLSGVRARDGRLWFPTTDGVVVIDPAAERLDVRPPVVALSRVTVDGEARPAGDGIVRVAPSEADIAIEYSAPTSVHPGQIHFRHRLRGAPWTEAGTARTVEFSHLRPGHYTFDVIASSSDGVWATTPTSLQITVEPHFWQTGWFAALLLTMVVAGGGGAFVMRVQTLKAQERKLTALVHERTAALHVANQRLQQLATEDALTGLANKRRLDEVVAAEWHRAIRIERPIAYLQIDVDHFKLYNDAYGHLVGDDCLRRVAMVIAASVRGATDLAARQGGEEFAVVLSDTDEEGGRVVAEKIRAGVEALDLEHRASPVAPVVTVSVGVATAVPSKGGSPTEMIAAADRALYAAKAAGRNRVV